MLCLRRELMFRENLQPQDLIQVSQNSQFLFKNAILKLYIGARGILTWIAVSSIQDARLWQTRSGRLDPQDQVCCVFILNVLLKEVSSRWGFININLIW